MFKMVLIFYLILLLFISKNNASSVYSHVGDGVHISWTLHPVPDAFDILEVRNTKTIGIFFVSGTTVSTVESSYTGRIVFNGDTATGQMTFTLRNVSRLDAGVYTASVPGAGGSAIYQGPTLYVFGKPTKPFVTQVSPPVVNKDLQLNCSTSSTTIPGNHNLSMTYIWNIDGVNITNSTGRYFVNGFRITIQNIQKDETNKIITCTGTERGGLTSDTSNTYKIEPLYGPGTITFTPSTTSYSTTEQGTIPDITCAADCEPNCSYRWTKDGQFTSHGSGSILSLRNINRNDTGVYRCTAWNDHGNMNSSNINVDVKYGPGTVTFTPSTTSYSLTEQETIPDITCTADCKPNCSYRWTKDEQFTSHGSGSTLSLRNINRNDIGVYRCTALNDHGTKNSNEININVRYGPQNVIFTPSSTSYSPEENETIPDITCTADCKPNCNYKWTKDGQITSHGSGSTLSLRNINCNVAGVYICTAWNDHGTKNTTDINIDVCYGPASVTFSPPSTSYSQEENKTISNITCSADCKPNCYYRWTKDGQLTSHGSGSSLSLRNINRNDAGQYRCTAWNEHGTKNTSDIDVNVQYIDLFTIISTLIYENTQDIQIACGAHGNPTNIVFYPWTQKVDNKRIRTLHGSVTSNTTVLRIPYSSYQDSGVYTCYVDNIFGTSKSKDIVVKVKDKPVITKKISLQNSNSHVEIIVDFYSVPKPLKIEWLKKGSIISLSEKYRQSNFEVDIELTLHDVKVKLKGYRAKLSIEGATDSDYGTYLLRIENNKGIATQQILFSHQEGYILIVGLSVGISVPVFIAVVAGIVCIHSKRKQQNQTDKNGKITKYEDIDGNGVEMNVYQDLSVEGSDNNQDLNIERVIHPYIESDATAEHQHTYQTISNTRNQENQNKSRREIDTYESLHS